MKTEIEFSIRKSGDNAYTLHYIVPNYSGSNKKHVQGDVHVSSLTRAIERMEMIVDYLKNPVPGKELHEVMSTMIVRQSANK